MNISRVGFARSETVPKLLSDTLTTGYCQLQNVARSTLKSREPALESPDDVVQSATAIALERWKDFRGTTRLECLGWLRAIVRNEARLSRRRQRREQQRRLSVARENLVLPIVTAELDVRQLNALRAAIAELPPLDRALLTLRGVQQQPFAAIARQLGQSAATLRQRWSRCRERLQAALSADDA